jgi:hypothetical protein
MDAKSFRWQSDKHQQSQDAHLAEYREWMGKHLQSDNDKQLFPSAKLQIIELLNK